LFRLLLSWLLLLPWWSLLPHLLLLPAGSWQQP
jgi:hypothetical protein